MMERGLQVYTGYGALLLLEDSGERQGSRRNLDIESEYLRRFPHTDG